MDTATRPLGLPQHGRLHALVSGLTLNLREPQPWASPWDELWWLSFPESSAPIYTHYQLFDPDAYEMCYAADRPGWGWVAGLGSRVGTCSRCFSLPRTVAAQGGLRGDVLGCCGGCGHGAGGSSQPPPAGAQLPDPGSPCLTQVPGKDPAQRGAVRLQAGRGLTPHRQWPDVRWPWGHWSDPDKALLPLTSREAPCVGPRGA